MSLTLSGYGLDLSDWSMAMAYFSYSLMILSGYGLGLVQVVQLIHGYSLFPLQLNGSMIRLWPLVPWFMTFFFFQAAALMLTTQPTATAYILYNIANTDIVCPYKTTLAEGKSA